MVRRIAGAVMILFVGLGVVASHTYSSGSIIIAGKPVSSTPAAAALLRSTTTAVAAVGGGDHCCSPATGTWSGLGTENYNGDHPSETCFVHTGCDTSTLMTDSSGCFCWSKSFYGDDGEWDFCYPKGYGAVWDLLVGKSASSCGTAPCQEFDSVVPTC